jgi:hypothetical protein
LRILAAELEVIPLDWADVFQWREIESIGESVALAEAGRFPPPSHQPKLRT